MNTKKNVLSTTAAFTYFALYWIVLGIIAFISALFSIFSPLFFFLYLLGGVIVFFSMHTERFRTALIPLLPIAGIVLVMTILWSLFTTPTVFTGRDQGSIATAAIMLADTHSLVMHTPASDTFFTYYGEGRALNFPGFFYTEDGALMTQFPIPYIAWLGVFYSIFGLFGFTLANTLLFILFALSFVILTKHITQTITHKKSTQIRATRLALLFLLVSFPFMWFFGHTLSENLAQFLIFFMLLQAFLFVSSVAQKAPTWQKHLHFWSATFTGALLTFTRIEGIALFGLMLFTFLIHPRTNDYLRSRMISHLFAPVITLLFTLALVFDKTTNFYKMIVKALLPSDTTLSTTSSASFLNDILNRFTEYLSYGILPFVIIGVCGAILLWKKKNYLALMPLFITAPILIYLINPHVSADAPWMLRRITFVILPLSILYSIVFILAQKRPVTRIITTILIVFSLPAYTIFFTFSENQNLFQQTQSLAEQFTTHDLILIDANVSGNNFAMLAGPFNTLHNKNAAYIFNPEDLTRVDMSRFQNIFLITSAATAQRYTDIAGVHLTERTRLPLTTTRLTHPPHTRLWDFPARDTVTTENIIYKITAL